MRTAVAFLRLVAMACALVVTVLLFVALGAGLGRRFLHAPLVSLRSAVCVGLAFPPEPESPATLPLLRSSPFFSDESDASLRSLLHLPVGGDCSGASGFAGATMHDVVRWRGAPGGGRNTLLPDGGYGKFRSCAVVGSSGALLDERHGSSIDGAEWVIRINSAPTPSALRAHVGRRTSVYLNQGPTSVRLLSAHTSRIDTGTRPPPDHTSSNATPASTGAQQELHAASRLTPRGQSASRIVHYCHVPWIADCWAAGRARGGGTGAVTERLSPRLVTWTRRRLRTLKWPTTGAMAIALALHVCNATLVFGFGPPLASSRPSSSSTLSSRPSRPSSSSSTSSSDPSPSVGASASVRLARPPSASPTGHAAVGGAMLGCAKYYGNRPRGRRCTSWDEYANRGGTEAETWHDWEAESIWIARLAAQGLIRVAAIG